MRLISTPTSAAHRPEPAYAPPPPARTGRCQRELPDELAAVQRESVSAAAIQRAVALFDPVWDMLLVPERFRILPLLIESVVYDGATGELELAFYSLGITSLAAEAALVGQPAEVAQDFKIMDDTAGTPEVSTQGATLRIDPYGRAVARAGLREGQVQRPCGRIPRMARLLALADHFVTMLGWGADIPEEPCAPTQELHCG
jgi:hypothetical protein